MAPLGGRAGWGGTYSEGAESRAGFNGEGCLGARVYWRLSLSSAAGPTVGLLGSETSGARRQDGPAFGDEQTSPSAARIAVP